MMSNPPKHWLNPVNYSQIAVDDVRALGNTIPECYMPELMAAYKADQRHAGTRITVTGGLTCPRKTFISRLLPYDINPQRCVSWHLGQVLHDWLGRISYAHESDEWWVETHNPEQCEFDGELFGIPMSCRMDKRRKDWGEIVDWKTSMNGKHKWAKEFADVGDACQLNMCRMLAGVDECDMTIWVVSGEFRKVEAKWMGADEVWNSVVGKVVSKGQPTCSGVKVGVIFSELHKAFSRVDDGEDALKVINDVPPLGEDMWRNGKGQSWCRPDGCDLYHSCVNYMGGL